MKIWLPDDSGSIRVDTASGGKEAPCTVYQQTITLTMQPVRPPNGFEKEANDDRE